MGAALLFDCTEIHLASIGDCQEYVKQPIEGMDFVIEFAPPP